MGIIHSVENLFGGKTYYDESGEVVGRSVENFFGGETIYRSDGSVAARTVENIFGGETIYTYEEDNYAPPPLKSSADWLDEIDFSKYDLD